MTTISDTKAALSKIHLATKVTLTILCFILLLAFGYPYLIKLIGAKLIVNNYVYGLGIKIVDETLLISYAILGAITVTLVIYSFSLLKKLNFLIKNLETSFNEESSKVEEKILLCKKNSEKIIQLANKANSIVLEQTAPQLATIDIIKNQLTSAKKETDHLSSELQNNQDYCKTITDLLDSLEKHCTAAESTSTPIVESQFNKCDFLQDNLFKLQMITFNASIEALKTNAAATLPTLISEIESLIKQNGPIAKDLEATIHQISNFNSAFRSKLTSEVVELGRFIAKLLYQDQKLTSFVGQLNSSISLDAPSTLASRWSSFSNEYKELTKNMLLHLSELQSVLNSITAPKITYSLKGKILIPLKEIKKNSTIATATPTTSRKLTPAAAVEASALPIIGSEEICKQNVASLYSIDPKQLRTLFFQQ
ncbi:MAG: hypothetical protein HQK50_05930 [Oligoflexia bacterium]|nr:hypothetical protein [Oligoflexia bacterium]MBF0365089.1 hypothetical protein [Oligoflexia bacterium]